MGPAGGREGPAQGAAAACHAWHGWRVTLTCRWFVRHGGGLSRTSPPGSMRCPAPAGGSGPFGWGAAPFSAACAARPMRAGPAQLAGRVGVLAWVGGHLNMPPVCPASAGWVLLLGCSSIPRRRLQQDRHSGPVQGRRPVTQRKARTRARMGESCPPSPSSCSCFSTHRESCPGTRAGSRAPERSAQNS